MTAVTAGALSPPPAFVSKGGRLFTVGIGERTARWPDDSLWSETWPILLGGQLAGQLFRSLAYGLGATGNPCWHASTRALYWQYANDAPTGIGFDVAAFDTAEEALAAWGASADQILDWAAGKPVPNIYDHRHAGVSQKTQ